MSDPRYEYRPWSPERKQRASEAAKARMARSRKFPAPVKQGKLKILGPKIRALIADRCAALAALEADLERARREFDDLTTAARVLERHGLI